MDIKMELELLISRFCSQDKPEKFLENRKTMINAENITQFTTNREINSTIEVKKLLENLDNPDINSPELVLQ